MTLLALIQQISFYLNEELVQTNLPAASILLDYIRSSGRTGTKIGCREGDCGACTVLVVKLVNDTLEYNTVTSCLTPIGNVAGSQVFTIEALNQNSLNPIQLAMHNENGTQCGFCTPGFVVSLTAAKITNQDLRKSVDGNICRCTGYASIIRAINSLKNIDSNDVRSLLPSEREIKKRLEPLKSTQSSDGLLIGGGSDIYVQKPREVVKEQSYHIVLDSTRRYIKEEDENIHIGCNTTMTDFIGSDIINSFISTDKMNLIASTPIRNQGTIAGNLVNASPIADFAIILLALDASIVLEKGTLNRELKLDQFYKGYKDIDLHKNEIVAELIIPKNDFKFNFEKVSKRTFLDIASVNTAISISTENNKIATILISAGGISPIPLVFNNLTKLFGGKEISSSILRDIINEIDSQISPISDIRGSKEYKRQLLRNLVTAHFVELFGEKVSIEEVLL